MRQDSEYRLARRALNAPNGETAEAEPGVMRVARQAPATGAGRFMFELKAQREEKGEDVFDKRLTIVKQLKVSGLIIKIDGNGAVLSCRFDGFAHVSSSVEMAVDTDETSCR